MSETFDRRITPWRDDLAADHLRGRVDAPRFAKGVARRAGIGRVAVRRAPSAGASLDTELLYGEGFTAYEEKNGWAWGQCASDAYIGYVEAHFLHNNATPITHRIDVAGSFVFPAPDLKKPPRDTLPLNAQLAVIAIEGDWARLDDGGFVFAKHLASIGTTARDFVALARQFSGVPYLWGGKTPQGFDCSGLVQTLLAACGIAAPRDTDMQQRALGEPVTLRPGLQGLRRGDLVFWKGHVGIMMDAATLVHANAHHMMTASEILGDAVKRIAAKGSQVTSVRRLVAA